jgi:uncharacterized protein
MTLPTRNTLNTLIVKVATRCNLACTYCYEYSAGDETWKQKPKFMKPGIVEKIGERIQEYAESTGVDSIRIVAHGGEPLLLGSAGLDDLFTGLRHASGNIRLRLGLQTNGVLITKAICDVLRRHNVFVGISLDGDQYANNRRVDHRGMESWSRVATGIDVLKKHAPSSFGGLLCVVDTSADPDRVLKALCDFGPPQLDFLQPFLTHDMAGSRQSEMAREFGAWMLRAMHAWLAEPRYKNVKIRVFEDAFRAACELPTQTDWFGKRSVSYLVIETDGNIDVLDQLKIIGSKSADHRLIKKTIFDSSLAEAHNIAETLLRSQGALDTPADCADCQYAVVCGASHLTSRYSSSAGFSNRSTYCEGLTMLLDEANTILRNRHA